MSFDHIYKEADDAADHLGDHREPAELRADLAACVEALKAIVNDGEHSTVARTLPGSPYTMVRSTVLDRARALLARIRS